MVRRPLALAIFVLSLLPAAWLAWEGRDMPHLGSFHDDGIYLNAAHNLATGAPYRIESLPWTPAQTKYPPLYALYLSLAWHAAPELPGTLPAAMLLAWLWLPVWIAGVYRLLRQQAFSPAAALGLSVLTAVHPYTQLGATRLMTDLMFAALAVWALVYFDRPRGLGAAIVLTGLAYLTRSAALPLMAGMGLTLLAGREFRKLGLFTAGSLAVVAGWMWWAGAHKYPARELAEMYYSDYFSYQARMVPLATIGAHIYRQLDYLVSAAATMLLVDFGDSFLAVMLERLLVLGAGIGIVRLVREGRMVAYSLYALFYALMMLIWYGPPEPRFLLPVLPLLLAGLGTEAMQFARTLWAAWEQGGANRGLAMALSAVLVLLPASMTAHALELSATTGRPMLAAERRQQAHTAEAYAWIRTHTAPGTQFFTIDDPVFYLYTGRRAMRLPLLPAIYEAAPGGALRPSAATLAAMDRYGLGCLFVSAKHFEQTGTAEPVLRFSVEGAGLAERYRTPTEIVACR